MSFITGTVTDSDGSTLQDATVYIVDADTGETEAIATTNSSGDYSASVTDNNTYDLTADKRNYEPREQTGVTVGSGDTVTVDFTTTLRAYKIRGEFADSYGIAVLGRNTVTNGTPIGVRGLVPDADGYGLETPDDARVEGDFEATSGHTLTVSGDPMLRLLPYTDNFTQENVTAGGSIVAGYEGNTVNGTVGSAVLGGGASGTTDVDGTTRDNTNEATADFGTVCGGLINRAGEGAFVGGGGGNDARGLFSTVGGGFENATSGTRATIAGGDRNTASGDESSVGGGSQNVASGDDSVIAGGDNNTTGGLQNAVAGGGNNAATGRFAFVGGGRSNEAGGRYPTIGGGFANVTGTSGSLELLYATVGGGEQNRIYGEYGTVGGGRENVTGQSGTTFGAAATVGGGLQNLLRGSYGTIAGGGPTDPSGDPEGTRNAVYDDYGTVGGGGGNRAGDAATSGTAAATYATVPGGRENEAAGAYSFAAGRRAKATNEGAFVWADSTDVDVTSSASDQFIVEAGGGVGIGEMSPRTQLHVANDSGSSTGPGGHAALVEDTDGNNARGLAIKLGDFDPSTVDNYISFYDAGDSYQGAIEGDGNDGVQLDGATADYGEYLPKRDPAEEISPAEVVGVVDGQITKDTTQADRALVVSDRSIVTGNSPGPDPADRADHEVCAFVGQVPVKIHGPVNADDLVVPSGEHDGTARAVEPAEYRPGDGPLVGRTWEATDESYVSEVTVAVGLETGEALESAFVRQRERLDRLASENETLRSENEALRERLEAVEAHLGLGASAAPADD